MNQGNPVEPNVLFKQPVRELITFIVPVFNEERGLRQFHSELTQFLVTHQFLNYEILFVNDGSSDRSLGILASLGESDKNVRIVNLTRNFGKEVALTAGFDFVSGLESESDCAVIPIDADLQHPFPTILEFVRKWRQGFDVVYGVQVNRQQGWVRKLLSEQYYRLLDSLKGSVEIPRNAGDFRLLSKRAVQKLNQFRESHRMMKGLYSTVGLKQAAVEFEARERSAGKSKWSIWNLVDLSIEGITSHSTAPLRLATLLGMFCAFVSILYAIITIFKTLIFGEPIAGYPTLITVILFLGSAQLISLGIIGEYLGRVFNETKNRPLYFVEGVYGNGEEEPESKKTDRYLDAA